MECPGCGVEVLSDADYCHRCGARIEWGGGQTSASAGGVARRPRGEEGGDSGNPLDSAVPRSAADADAEREIWEGGYSPRAMIGSWVAAGVLTLGAVAVAAALRADWPVMGLILLAAGVMWLGLYALLVYRRLSVRYRLTNHRFFHESGLLRRVTDRVEVIDIDDIACEQGVLERLVDVGTIRLTSSDRTHPELSLPGISAAREVASLIDDARREERRKRGLHIETI